MPLRHGLLQINVTDRATAKAFYVDALGLSCRKPHGPKGPFEVPLPGGPVLLIYSRKDPIPTTYDSQGMVPILFTDDLGGTIRAWRAKGVELLPISWGNPDGTAECPYGRFIAFRDPFGNAFELLEPRKK